ncbi:MAG: hypothetical protein WCK39_05560 [Methanomassiliicoccales archaeon]
MEYYIYGFHQLLKEGKIDSLKMEFKTGPRPGFIFKEKARTAKSCSILTRGRIGKISSPDNWYNLEVDISDGHIHRNGIINILDTPWDFGSISDFKSADIFFKCQYPSSFKSGLVPLSDCASIKIDTPIMEEAKKVRPLMLGRPLSRQMDMSIDEKLLKRMCTLRNCRKSRKFNLLAFLGMARDDINIACTHHPHLKRAAVAEWIIDNIPKSKVVFRKPSQAKFMEYYSDRLRQTSPILPISDSRYFSWCFNSYSTINITGLRGSIPFRIVDSFLTGMCLFSDDFYVDWYHKLEKDKDYLSIGKLGYYNLNEIEISESLKILKDHIENVATISNDLRECREYSFNKYYSPSAVAEHIIHETLSS